MFRIDSREALEQAINHYVELYAIRMSDLCGSCINAGVAVERRDIRNIIEEVARSAATSALEYGTEQVKKMGRITENKEK